ncbi:fumarylacetoacetate hydrolase family protein [Poseidonocella sp. HB161398]|uniref:fumarylacetoacetate hydrolase family protein n=1 Tax=Poseidonocella sp. HB161398 TaxID=2320855 RepID=UPI001109E38C|nr:fumarylacetoacetate hydrolase family protein [Poseidonocella sp. HB161398]
MSELSPLAAALIAAHETGTRIQPEAGPASAAEAFAVQAEVSRHFGAVGGFKVGQKPGADPIMAPIRADKVLASGGAVKVADKMAIELEVGFEILSPLPAGATPAELAKHVRPLPAIELVDTRLAGPLAGDPLAKLADNQINGGLVLGKPLTGWDGSDFGKLTAKLTAGEETVLDGETEVPFGSALTTLSVLADFIGTHCGGLQPGQVVITGTLCGIPYFPAGTEIRGSIEGLGEVNVSLL